MLRYEKNTDPIDFIGLLQCRISVVTFRPLSKAKLKWFTKEICKRLEISKASVQWFCDDGFSITGEMESDYKSECLLDFEIMIAEVVQELLPHENVTHVNLVLTCLIGFVGLHQQRKLKVG